MTFLLGTQGWLDGERSSLPKSLSGGLSGGEEESLCPLGGSPNPTVLAARDVLRQAKQPATPFACFEPTTQLFLLTPPVAWVIRKSVASPPSPGHL